MHHDDLLLGIDAGGSKTIAWLAHRDHPPHTKTIGRGRSGPANGRSVGFAEATANLDRAIEAAFADAKLSRTTVASACLAVAGADRPAEQQLIRSWAAQQKLAERLTITNDALPVLYSASSDGVGVALISGTGSLAIARNAQGEIARCGGWGGLFSDEGSGYKIALAGLQAAARDADGRGPRSDLLPRILEHYQRENFSELIPVIYGEDSTRATIASLAPLVFAVAQAGDAVAHAILDQAASELAEMVTTVASRLALSDVPFACGLTGSVLLKQADFAARVSRRLSESGLQPRLQTVPDPVAGAIAIAASDH